MEEIVIELTFRKEDFEEIYFADGNKNIFLYPPARKFLFIIIALIIFWWIIYFLSINFPIINWLLFAIIVVIIICACYYLRIAFKYISWKNKVVKHITEISKFKYFKIILKQNSFEYNQDDDIKIEKWENIKSSRILNNSIFLVLDNQENYLFPSKSMKPEEYEKFKDFIKEKTK
jgi:hypothetical protein